MKTLVAVVFAIMLATTAQAAMSLGEWTPLYKGIEHAIGTNTPSSSFPRLQSVNVLRIDLTDPDVQLFPSFRHSNYVENSTVESYAMSVSNFLKRTGVAVATAANFYYTANGASPTTEGIASQVFGLLITTGAVVSIPDFGSGTDANNRAATFLFTTNKEAYVAFFNNPPGTNTAGIYTAVTGYYPVLMGGAVPEDTWLRATYPDRSVHDPQPRTVFGLSADRRYLFLMLIDGRQPGYSDGATSVEMGQWMQLVGASDAISMDGGGSASMYMQDCVGDPKPLGRSSFLSTVNPKRERIIGCQFGVYAAPLPSPIYNIVATPGTTSATITWNTTEPGSSQVAYGRTTNLNMVSALDYTPKTTHSVTLAGLSAGTRYYFKVLSVVNGSEYGSECGNASFTTTNFGGAVAFALTNTWRYSFANVSGENWTSLNYNDTAWPTGRGALWAYSGTPPSYTTTQIPNFSTGTRMPTNPGDGYPYVTYYFRHRFVFSNDTAGVTLTFSNFIDDGAVFYLNGREVYRTVNMPAIVDHSTYTTAGAPCPAVGTAPAGNATCPITFSAESTNLVTGTNIVAVEVHNFRSLSSGTPSPDATFQSALHYTLPPPVELPPFISNVIVAAGETNAAITWTTRSNATSRVEYGRTAALGSTTPLNPNAVTNHAVALSGLQPLADYFFRIISSVGTNVFTHDGIFSTVPYSAPLLTMTNTWRFTAGNLDGTAWTTRNYNDSGWEGQGPALLYNEDNSDVGPRSTLLPFAGGGFPAPTYYFRTRFNFAHTRSGFSIVFTNHIDDGAVFYLNGVEIQRIRMNPGPVTYTTLANGCPPDSCDSSREVPDIFSLSGDAMTNVVDGENVLAVEVHQLQSASTDVVFGSAVSVVRTTAPATPIYIARNGNVICVTWSGAAAKLQQATSLTGTNAWSDLNVSSPYCVTNAGGARYFRLKN